MSRRARDDRLTHDGINVSRRVFRFARKQGFRASIKPALIPGNNQGRYSPADGALK
jgi:hypothetical protein